MHLQVQTPQPFYPCGLLEAGPLFCAGVPPKKSGCFEHVSRGLNQHNLPQLDTLGLLNYVGMARCHLNMDGSLPENEKDPGRCNFVPTTPELVEGANWLDPYRLSRSQRHAFHSLGKTISLKPSIHWLYPIKCPPIHPSWYLLSPIFLWYPTITKNEGLHRSLTHPTTLHLCQAGCPACAGAAVLVGQHV